MGVERVDYGSDNEFEQARAMEEEQSKHEWEAQQAEKEAAEAQQEADHNAEQEYLNSQGPEESGPDEMPF